MTSKEAIEILKQRKVCMECVVEPANCDNCTEAFNLAIKALEDRPQGELTEINHRLNLLIGVLYTNQLISESDLKYIEDSIKKLMKGGG